MVSAAPEQIRVSVFGGRTQLDIALPSDVPVSSLVADLARLVGSRDGDADASGNEPGGPGGKDSHASKDERRSFWVLSRFDSGTVLRPDQTLREAGVGSGELLRLSSQLALSPPTLYDDVVDAVGRLNKAAHAAWDAVSARWMAFVGVHLAALGIVYCLVGRREATNHYVIVGLAAAVALALVGGAAMAHRSYSLDDVAAALGWAAIPITAGIAWAVLSRYGDYGVAAAWGAVVVACLVFDRVVGTGPWAYLASALMFAVIGAAMLGRALQLRFDIVLVTLAVLATLLCLAVRRWTARLGRFQTPTVAVENNREDWDFENPFEPPAPTDEADSGTTMPTAEAVWTRATSAAITRAALLAGLAAGVAVVLALLLDQGLDGVRQAVNWPEFTLALACAAVLALRTRTLDTWFERAALGGPAVAILVLSCALAQHGSKLVPVAALGALLAVTLGAAVAGLMGTGGGPSHRVATLLSYLEYLAVGSLIPLALWVAGVYQRLGFG
ncbi:type VII secretion integral membrane protein EccD [Mycobacterium asiaticum]|uniref:Type VII secretion integral membrane protein EccD n=1 Tax=Mycobacterium asiaticum TaxID=1790 RepID=A0A1A3NJR5_MYCAS|nr:type VII secretion integral membrane protein EccD [Mycobacterium asiaticum]